MALAKRVGAPDCDPRVYAAFDQVPPERAGQAADVLGIEHGRRAPESPQARGQRVDIRTGGRAEDRAAEVNDRFCEPSSFPSAGRGHDQNVLFQRDTQAVPVMSAAKKNRVSE